MVRTRLVFSAREFVDLLPRLRAEGRPTLALGPMWTVQRLLSRLRHATAVVSDVDGTVIRESQWIEMRKCMTEACGAEYDRGVAAYYRGERSDAGDLRLIYNGVRWLRESGLTDEMLRERILAQPPRDGVRDLFRTFPRRNVALVTFGLHDYAAGWAIAHDVPVDETFALHLRWRDEGGRRFLDGCDEATVVTEATKGAACRRFCADRGIAEHDVLVLEDTPNMLVRMRHRDNLAVLIVPLNDAHTLRTEERLRQLSDDGRFEDIDAFLVADDFHLLAEMRAARD